MSNLAYVRVSSIEQNIDRQEIAINKVVDIDKWFIEKVSGKNRNRPELNKLLDYVREGDTVYIHSLDRLGRNTRDLLSIVEDLSEQGVILRSLKDDFVFDNSSSGKLVLTIMSAVAEFERNINKERQLEGIEVAKEKGLYKGRKPIEINKKQFEELYADWKNGYINQKQFYKRLNISRTTLYRRIKSYEEELKKNDKNDKER